MTRRPSSCCDEEVAKLLRMRNPELDSYACTEVASKGANRYAAAFIVAWVKSSGFKLTSCGPRIPKKLVLQIQILAATSRSKRKIY